MDKLVDTYVDGLHPTLRPMMRDIVAEKPNMSFQKIKVRAKRHGDSLRAGGQARTSPYAGLSPVHPRTARRPETSPKTRTQRSVMLVEPENYPEAYDHLVLPVETGSEHSQSLPSLPSGMDSQPSLCDVKVPCMQDGGPWAIGMPVPYRVATQKFP